MLYDRWLEIVREQRDALALHDTATGRSWTFAALAAQVERHPKQSDRIVFPTGINAEFVLNVLRGWRDGSIVCPLESGQVPADFTKLHDLAGRSNIRHVKTTSATTGVARAIVFTEEQIAADALNVVNTMGLRPDCPNLGVISLAHSYGFSNLVTPLLLQGIPLLLAPAPLPEAVRQTAKLARKISLPAVPAMWRAWLMAEAIPPNVALAISAGSPLPLALEQEVFSRHALKIHNFYGASECGGIAYDRSEAPRSDPAYVGMAMNHVSLNLAEDGCLLVASSAVAEGYWPQTGNGLGNGCYHTSDMAEINGGGIYLRGRASDLINVAGRKVSPEFIERTLSRNPQVQECLVFGVPSRDAERTEEIVAVVATKLKPEQLRELALGCLPAWQSPRHWQVVETIQTNVRGKVSRAEWRRHWLAECGV